MKNREKLKHNLDLIRRKTNNNMNFESLKGVTKVPQVSQEQISSPPPPEETENKSEKTAKKPVETANK